MLEMQSKLWRGTPTPFYLCDTSTPLSHGDKPLCRAHPCPSLIDLLLAQRHYAKAAYDGEGVVRRVSAV